MSRPGAHPIFVVREAGRLHPATQIDEDAIRELPAKRQLVAWVRRPSKSIQELRLYWGILRKALQARPDQRWPTTRRLADTLLIETGFRRIIVRLDGGVEVAPASIATMTHDEFHQHFKAAMPLVREHVLGCDPEAFDLFMADVADVLGIDRTDIMEAAQ